MRHWDEYTQCEKLVLMIVNTNWMHLHYCKNLSNSHFLCLEYNEYLIVYYSMYRYQCTGKSTGTGTVEWVLDGACEVRTEGHHHQKKIVERRTRTMYLFFLVYNVQKWYLLPWHNHRPRLNAASFHIIRNDVVSEKKKPFLLPL